MGNDYKMLHELSARKWKFVIEYCVDFNATQAAIRAGYAENAATEQGSRLLTTANVKSAIEERKKDLAAAAALNPEWILRQWMALATGNPAEHGKLQRVNCRHCYGYDHNYQWTEFEYRKALDEAIKNGTPAPDASGGFGYDVKAEPNLECSECGGDGLERIYLADTDKVSGTSRGLFAGIKMTANGPEIKLRDQDAALKNLAAYLGMSIDRKEISGPGGKPLAINSASVTAKDLTDDQLAAVVVNVAE